MIQVHHFPANTAGRDFVVGDIHGCVDQFMALMTMAHFNPAADRVFSTGDLVDRGPDSMGALRLLQADWFFAVLGNHELMMLEAMAEGALSFAYQSWMINGGDWIHATTRQEADEALAQALSLPIAIVVGDGPGRFNVLHAEFFGTDAQLDAGNFHAHTINEMLWGRRLYQDVMSGLPLPPHLPESPTFVGHTIVPRPLHVGSVRFIDTGSFCAEWGQGGGITLVEPATGESWTTVVKAAQL